MSIDLRKMTVRYLLDEIGTALSDMREYVRDAEEETPNLYDGDPVWLTDAEAALDVLYTRLDAEKKGFLPDGEPSVSDMERKLAEWNALLATGGATDASVGGA